MSGSTEVAARLPVLRVPRGSITPYVLTVGDPERARQLGLRLDEGREVGRYREYWTYQGRWQGVPLTVASHGVGGAGAAIAFEELIQGGAQTILRLGTAGSFVAGIRSGDLIVATAAVRGDGVSERLLPLAYPAVADPDVTAALVAAASEHPEARFARGIVLSTATFYPGLVPDDRAVLQQAGVIGVEMELATLFIVAALRGVRAGGIVTVDGNPEEDAGGIYDYDPHRPVVEEGKVRMIDVSLEAIVRLAGSRAQSTGGER